MANYQVSGSNLTSVANAIRTKGETDLPLEFPEGFVSAIEDIQIGINPSGTINITQNGTVDVTNYANASVAVPGGSTFSTKSITENGTYNASSDNVDGYSSVTVTVPQMFTKVGEYSVLDNNWANSVSVVNVCSAVLDGYMSSNTFAYLLIIKNNSATGSYKCNAICIATTITNPSELTSSNCFGLAWRGDYSAATGVGSTSMKISNGSVIDIYKAPMPT